MFTRKINSKTLVGLTPSYLNKFNSSITSKFFIYTNKQHLLKSQNIISVNKANDLKKNIYAFHVKNFFSGGKKDKDDAKNDQKIQPEDAEAQEDTVPLKKYNLLKELYEDSESNLQKARTKFDELRKAYIETQSDLERIRKRSEIEISQAKEFAITKFAKDILDVYDNFDRALSSIKEIQACENQEEKLELYKNFSEGVSITKDSLTRILGVHGVKEYIPLKEKFDPSKHDAVFQSTSKDLPIGTVSDVMQTGFTIGTRILRPAKVGVVKSNK